METCKHCRALRQEWYQNLQLTGFTDIEKNGNLRTTAQSHQIRKDLQTEVQFNARQSYYLWAQAKAEQAKFESKTDKKIWAKHAEGFTLREMEPEIGLDYSYLSRKIKKIEKYIKEQASMIVASVSYLQAVSR